MTNTYFDQAEAGGKPYTGGFVVCPYGCVVAKTRRAQHAQLHGDIHELLEAHDEGPAVLDVTEYPDAIEIPADPDDPTQTGGL